MTLLDVFDLNKIWTVNFMWENEFFEPWAKVGAALVWNLWENQNWWLLEFDDRRIFMYFEMLHKNPMSK